MEKNLDALRDKEILNFLVSIGIDYATNTISRGPYARICVEIDLLKPLVAKFKMRRRVRRVEYEGLHLVCFGCGLYGH